MDSELKEQIHRLSELYADDIYRYARLTLNDDNEANDVVQEVFFRAFKAWHNFRKESSEKTWLASIARNYMFDLLKKKKKTKQFLSTYMPPYLSDEQTNITEVLIVEDAVTHLKESYRQVFILRHVEELTVAQTAETLGWTEGRVRITDMRALTKLRERLSEGKGVQDYNEFDTQN
ncbi:RNA polymerase sigma factor [Alicyclobacillus sp. SO9]|uniref:RNA polymerase sigma factor n=1 Tax=Alicyclobacillus sp. SO9 TaxID=2665646 RepID=UPI0018E8337C|nr:RNA polymerase sigma factor [Alicyclobacillus sp. SO9]QQE79645.1 RNA polymerase sigma factor [Alicyclobacillus sp. SO9]